MQGCTIGLLPPGMLPFFAQVRAALRSLAARHRVPAFKPPAQLPWAGGDSHPAPCAPPSQPVQLLQQQATPTSSADEADLQRSKPLIKSPL